MSPRLPPDPDAAPRLLLVDADAGRAGNLSTGLAEAIAILPSVVEVRAGRHAVEALRLESFDIVLVDLASLADVAPTPEDGVARLVRLADGALTIVLSEAATVSAAVAVMRAGAHDFIARPVAAMGLVDRIGELARRHGKARLYALDTPRHDAGEALAGALEIGSALLRQPQGLGMARQSIQPMWRQEQRIIEEAIASFSGNVALAAAALQLSPSTIYRKRQAWAESEEKRGAA